MNNIILTLDIDWAPDFVIEQVARTLIKQRVKATWFITHSSPALALLRHNPELFELGIHPNFLPHSTHGTSTEEVLQHCMSLVPEATSMRTHAGVQSVPLLNQVMALTPITLDSSIYLPHAKDIQPVSYWVQGKELSRIPAFWEDDLETERPDGCWTLEALSLFKGGLTVFGFHPIHIYTNARDMAQYRKLRDRVPLSQIAPSDLSPRPLSQQGSGSFFLALVNYLAQCGDSRCLRELG